MRVHGDLRTLGEVRRAIDAIDDRLVELLGQRFAAIRAASEIKDGPEQALVPWRVEEVAQRVRARASEMGFDADTAERIWRAMMQECIAFERERLADRAARRTVGST